MTHDIPDAEALHNRLEYLPPHHAYADLVGCSAWGHAMDRLVPPHMRKSVVLWVALGREDMLVGFLSALLSNDLMGALGKADDANRAAIYDWATFLHNYAPAGCYGSPTAVREWQGLLT